MVAENKTIQASYCNSDVLSVFVLWGELKIKKNYGLRQVLSICQGVFTARLCTVYNKV